jgi:hypothetical protein
MQVQDLTPTFFVEFNEFKVDYFKNLKQKTIDHHRPAILG